MPMLERYLYVMARSWSVQRLVKNAARARDVQHEILLQKIRRHAESDFGRDHGFSQIQNVADFRRQVPVSNYEYYQPYIDRLLAGEVHAMFRPGTRVLMMAMTSGTTNRSKHIPVTQEFFDEYRRGWTLWGVATYRDHLDLLKKKTVKLGSNWREHISPGGIPCGSISGLVAETAPLVGRSRFALPAGVYQIDTPQAKHYTALRLALACREVGMVGTANPSTLIEFARLADKHRASLIRDIHDGTLSQEFDVSSAVRTRIRPQVQRRDPARAQQLEKIIEEHGHLYPKHFWPSLSVLAVWMGGSVGVYLPKLKEFWGQPALRDHGLSASEGRMTMPLQDGSSAGMLEYFHHFFEFIPEEEHDSPHPTVLEAHELEAGKNYFILLSTSGGLYRYDIHDLVQCVSFEGTAPVLKFLNKGAHFSSITGEKLSEFQIVSAVKECLAQSELIVEHFTVAPKMADRPGYVLLLEQGIPQPALEELGSRVEQRLQELNCEYAEKRRTNRLTPLTVQTLNPGTWTAFRQQRVGPRGNFEEYKHPCLVNDLQFIEKLEAAG